MAWIAGLAAVFYWPFRKRMRMIRWGVVALLLSLCLVMQAPIWFVIAGERDERIFELPPGNARRSVCEGLSRLVAPEN
jgi:hypothetical protein